MISIVRVLPFELFAASNYVALRHGTAKHRFCYLTYLRFGRYLGIIGVPLSIWLMVFFWKLPGQHGGAFGGSCGLLWFFGYLACYRWLFKRKMRKLYKLQDLGLPWTIEVSRDGIHSAIRGRSDTRFDWAFFDSFAEADAMFTLLKKERLIFLTIGKDSIDSAQQDELRSLLSEKLGHSL